MATIHLEAQFSSEEILKALENLSPSEFEQFVAKVLALRARRQAPSLPRSESALFARINAGLPKDLRQSYDELIAKRRDETLLPAEHAELLRLTDEVEKHHASRLEAVAELARLRRTSLAALLRDLGIPPSAND